MKRKNRLKTNSIRTIKKSFPRFLSLVIMSALGVLVYVGLTATDPDMLKTLDNYYDKYNTYDINITSSMGLTDDDITSLSQIEGVDKIEGVYRKDVLIENDNQESVLEVLSMPSEINELELVEGRLPENDNEIVVEENFLKKQNYELNDQITLDDETFKNKEFTIVGVVDSPLYFNNVKINQNRGTTTIGTGVVNYYSYILPSNFDVDYYTTIYLTVSDSKSKTTSSEEYTDLIDEVTAKIKEIQSTQEENRYQDIYNTAKEEIDDAEKEANEELDTAKEKLDDAKDELDSAKKKLDQANKKLTTAKSSLSKAKKQITEGKQELEDTLTKYNITDIDKSLKEVESNITQINKVLKTLSETSTEYQTYTETLKSLKTQQTLLNTLKETQTSLESAEKTYNSNYSQYKSSLSEYQKGLKEYNTNLKKYEESKEEYEENKTKALEEIEEAKEELNDIKHPTWYIYDRSDDQTYASYINQTKSIHNLSALFPVVFYAVAILVSLISMNRMVEDDRGEIGTLKSLGFTNHEIKRKYLIFSLSATLIGSLIGVSLGLTIIPYLIFIIYRLLFDLPNFAFSLNLPYTLAGIIIAIICICGASIITANKVLKEKPASLMRPKAPKAGKKILLEKITPLWHRLKFSNKITIRNLFRYKKRVLVTIIGICGCTALMLCGFGIKDCIVDITNMQYGTTFTYDAIVYTNDLDTNEVPQILDNDKITDYTISESLTGTLNDSSVNIVVTETEEKLKEIVNLYDENDNLITPELSENEVIITDKLADNNNIKIGDTITILDSDKNSYTFVVANIVKNYLGHYIYMNKESLEYNDKEYEPNVIYLKTEELTDSEKDSLSNNLLENDSVINVVHTHTLVDSANDMLDSLNKVIVILVLLSAMLSFVVLYNLSNINISERKREIATLKVLGFYDKEVDNYITKETIILTMIGIILGLGFGIILTNLTIATVEMENYRFLRNISLHSFIYSSIISISFTLIVNFVTHFTLRKINMIESLKSVE